MFQALKKMMDRIRKFQILNYQIFSIIEKYTNTLPIMEPQIQYIDPPAPEMNDYETIQNLKLPSKPNAGEENNNDNSMDQGKRLTQDLDQPDYDDEEFQDDNPGESEA